MRLAPQPTLGERVADGLRDRILSGELPPGTDLKQDHLAEEFGVSRIPIREALQMLQRDGLVEAMANRRVIVSPLVDDDLNDRYAVRALIEGEAAARAAMKHAAEPRMAQAIEWNEEAKSVRDRGAFLSASGIFHRAIWEAAGGSTLKAVATQLWGGRDFIPTLDNEQFDRATWEHQQILNAIESGSSEKARRAMADHIIGIGQGVRAYRSKVSDVP